MKDKKIDILIVGDNSLLTVGGEQESTKIIINNLKNIFKIGVIHPGKTIKDDNVQYFHITDKTRIKHIVKNPLAFFSYINSVRKIIKKNNPKIIHTQAQISFFIVSLLKKGKLIPSNSTLIHTERGLYTKYGILIKQLFYSFTKQTNIFITTTEFNMNYWKSALQKNKNLKYEIVENTAGELFEIYDDKLDHEVADTITIGFAGRYANWKNWPLAIRISEKLNYSLGDRVNIKMAVGCLDEKSLIETKKMFKHMEEIFGDRFSGDININLKEMDMFYYDLDVFILTSNHNTESFGRTLVEAMSRNTVVFTTDAGGSVEVVNDASKVLENDQEFVDAILKLYESKELLNIEKAKSMEIVKQNYSLNNNISKHYMMYKSILENNL